MHAERVGAQIWLYPAPIGLPWSDRNSVRPGTGCGAAWLTRLTGGQEVGGSSPPSPTRNGQFRALARSARVDQRSRFATEMLPNAWAVEHGRDLGRRLVGSRGHHTYGDAEVNYQPIEQFVAGPLLNLVQCAGLTYGTVSGSVPAATGWYLLDGGHGRRQVSSCRPPNDQWITCNP